MRFRIAVLPGDGIGPEVVAAATHALAAVAATCGHRFDLEELPIGAVAIARYGKPLPEETARAAAAADAVLLGAVGDPRFGPEANPRPEQGLLELRELLGVFANLRPIPMFPAATDSSPLRPERTEGCDLLFVRELAGGLYTGPRSEQGDGESAFDTMLYSVSEVERVARVAFEAARRRTGRLTSVDKANVLASSRLWRRTVEAVAQDYPDVRLEHAYVDAFAMALLIDPRRHDVVLTENLFGDILSDEAAALAGSLGVLPSASLGANPPGLFEPVHGSAPELAGRNRANPVGAILSAALLLRHGLDLPEEATIVERAVTAVLADGLRTADLCRAGEICASTSELSAAIHTAIKDPPWALPWI
ncbi:MAG TPA: 3-isopropylmalate dehydrogenase [Thermoanaerobaculia bacterium]|nr:3-isopropylmalate dehydrogenase [Thermoanaerobaculia bacterium]